MGHKTLHTRPPRKPTKIQRQANRLLGMAGEEFNDLFLSSQVVPESGDLPFFSSNITQVEVGTNLGTEGRFFPKGIPRESMLGKFVEKEYGSRFLDKPLVHASRPTLPVVMHEFTHKAINDIKLHTTTREFKNLIKPVTLGGMEMDEEDYIRIIDMRRLPENIDMRDEVKNYFTKLRTKKISEDEFNSLEANEAVLDNLKTLELLVALLPSKTAPVFDSEKNEIEVDFSKTKPPRKPTSPEAIVRSREFLEAAAQLNPLALLGRNPDKMIFSDINFPPGSLQGFSGYVGAITYPPQLYALEGEPFLKKILEERDLEEEFGSGGFSVVGASYAPQRGKPRTFQTALHEMAHVAFMRDFDLRKAILTPDGKLPVFGNGAKINEESLLKIIEIRSGLEQGQVESVGPGIVSHQIASLRIQLNDLELTKKGIFKDKTVKKLLKRLDYEVGRRLNIPKPIRVGVGR